MHTTTYGYEQPDTGDKSKGTSGWMAAYNFNVTRGDAHSHNGVDSAPLVLSSVPTVTQTALTANWVVSGGSGYKQNLTVPASVLDINSVEMRFVINSGTNAGQNAYLLYLRLTATTYTLYCNDNTIDILVIFR